MRMILAAVLMLAGSAMAGRTEVLPLVDVTGRGTGDPKLPANTGTTFEDGGRTGVANDVIIHGSSTSISQPAAGHQVQTSVSNTGRGSITNTCYIQSVTTTITGNGWIDCRGAVSIQFTVLTAGRSDATAHAGLGATLIVDTSGEISSNLPTTDVDPRWNVTSAGTPFHTQNGRAIALDTPPAAVRMRWNGPSIGSPGPTLTVMYHIVYPSSGAALMQAGPTPPALY